MPERPSRESANAARSTNPFAACFFPSSAASHNARSGYIAEASEVTIASAAATKKIFRPFITARNGISAPIAPSPVPYTLPRMHIAATATTADAITAGKTGRFIPLPASIKTGAAKNTFIKA